MNEDLDDLLTGEATSTETVSLDRLIELLGVEKAQGFTSQILQVIINSWAINDRVVQIVTKPGYSEYIKELINSVPVGELTPPLDNVVNQLRPLIFYIEREEEEALSIVTLKQQIELQEILSVQGWANSPENKLYETIRQGFGLSIQPTDQELRLMILMDVLLDLRENRNRNKIVTASNMPDSRLPFGLR